MSIRTMATVALALTTCIANADNRIDLIVGTYYFDREIGFNESNPGLAISHQPPAFERLKVYSM